MRLTFSILIMLIVRSTYSQNIELIDYLKVRELTIDCDYVHDCIDSIKLDSNVLTIRFYTKITNEYDPPLKFIPRFKGDSLFLDYQSNSRFIKDTIFYDTISQKLDTQKIYIQSVNVIPDKYSCMRIVMKLQGINKLPDYFEYEKTSLSICSKEFISYDLYKTDTINIIDSDGQRQGLWITFYESGEIKEKLNFDHGRFIHGTTFDKEGNDLDYLNYFYNGYPITRVKIDTTKIKK